MDNIPSAEEFFKERLEVFYPENSDQYIIIDSVDKVRAAPRTGST